MLKPALWFSVMVCSSPFTAQCVIARLFSSCLYEWALNAYISPVAVAGQSCVCVTAGEQAKCCHSLFFYPVGSRRVLGWLSCQRGTRLLASIRNKSLCMSSLINKSLTSSLPPHTHTHTFLPGHLYSQRAWYVWRDRSSCWQVLWRSNCSFQNELPHWWWDWENASELSTEEVGRDHMWSHICWLSNSLTTCSTSSELWTCTSSYCNIKVGRKSWSCTDLVPWLFQDLFFTGISVGLHA